MADQIRTQGNPAVKRHVTQPTIQVPRNSTQQGLPSRALQLVTNAPPSTPRPADILALHRTVGNRTVQRLLAAQAQRRTNKEEEEEKPAQRKSVDSSVPPSVQRKDKEPGEEEELQMRPLRQRRLGENSDASAVHQETKTGLPDALKAGIESVCGMGMDDVRVHYNSSKPAKVQALAYTQSTEIHIAPGQEQHLPHEAWHVVQQKQGRVSATLHANGVPINDDVALEREATSRGEEALALGIRQPDAAPQAERRVIRSAPFGQVIQGRWVDEDAVKDREKMQSDPLGALHDYAASKPVLREHFLRLLMFLKSQAVGGQEVLAQVQTILKATVEDENLWSTPKLINMVVRVDTQEEMADAEHYEDAGPGAREEDVEPGDLNLAEFESNDPVLWAIFQNMAARYGGQPTPEKYEAWYKGGVVTREGFRQLVAPSRTIEHEKLQPKRLPGALSYQNQYNTYNFGTFTDVTYKTDAKANIDFGVTHVTPKVWKNPIEPSSKVELTHGANSKTHGLTSGLKMVNISRANRGQHFSIANRIKKLPDGNNSPATWTWHHLTKEYEMVLVDREVHRKHGHNGGYLVW